MFNYFSVMTVLALMSSAPAHAGQLTTTIKEMLSADSEYPTALALSNADGRVYEISNTNTSLLNTLALAAEARLPVQLNLSTETHVESAQLLTADVDNTTGMDNVSPATSTASTQHTTPATYTPSVYSEKSGQVSMLFSKMAKNSSFQALSQCFRRAHTWAYDLSREQNVQSMKAFLFFTKKFIRETRFGWWFHVAPFVYEVAADGTKTEMVLEKSYSDKPVSMYDWMALFVGEGILCKEAKNYQYYEAHQEDMDCLIRKVPMYYYQPDNLEALDKEGVVLDHFTREDLTDMNLQVKRPRPIE